MSGEGLSMRIVLVLGAGSSLANAQYFRPVQRQWSHPPLDYTFFDKIEQLEQLGRISVPTALERYASRLPVGSPFGAGSSGRMEAFFREVFHDFLESGDTNTTIKDAYLQLVDIYAGVIRETTNWMQEDNYTGGPVGRLLALSADTAGEVDVITFNHDLIIENEIVKRARLANRWCLEQGYGTFSNGRTFISTRASMFRKHSRDCDHARPIVIHKLHGSLNWLVRIRGRAPTHSMLTGQTGSATARVSRRRSVPGALQIRTTGRTGKMQTSYTWPVIVPPVYAKQSLIRAFMPSVWADARQAIEHADRVIFFGYSMPSIDIEAEKLFERAIAKNTRLPWVGVIDPAPGTVERYAQVLREEPLRRFAHVDHFLDQGDPWG